MIMKTKKSIAQYQFEDSIKGINAIWVGHILLVMLYILGGFTWFYTSPHFWFCLVSALFFLGRTIFYDWNDSKINIALMIVYLISWGIELGFFGLPSPLMEFSSEMNKGIFLDVIVALIPAIYMGLRLVLVIPLIHLVHKQNKVLSSA